MAYGNYTTVNDLISMDGVRHLIDRTYLVPISLVFQHFDSVDDSEGVLDDDTPILTLREVVDDVKGDDRYLAVSRELEGNGGFPHPLSASATCRLLDGHHRLAVLEDLGWSAVPIEFAWVPEAVA